MEFKRVKIMKATPIDNVNDRWQGASPKVSGSIGELQNGSGEQIQYLPDSTLN